MRSHVDVFIGDRFFAPIEKGLLNRRQHEDTQIITSSIMGVSEHYSVISASELQQLIERMSANYRREFPQAFEIAGLQLATTGINNNRTLIEHYLGCSRPMLGNLGLITFKHRSELAALVAFASDYQCNDATLIYYVKQKSP